MFDAKRFELRMPMRWGDMDAQGHVNNTVYFRYLEETRVSWLRLAGWIDMRPAEQAALAHVSCDFVRSLMYPGEVLVRQEVVKVGRSSANFAYEMTRIDEPGVVYARATAVLVWTDMATGKSLPIPDHLRAPISV